MSMDECITIKLLNPPLVSPRNNDSGFVPDVIPELVKMGEGVIAQWEGGEDVEMGGDPSVLGKDRKFYWLYVVPPLGEVDLSPEWAVVVPTGEGDVGSLNL